MVSHTWLWRDKTSTSIFGGVPKSRLPTRQVTYIYDDEYFDSNFRGDTKLIQIIWL
jgi:hypothetical protein